MTPEDILAHPPKVLTEDQRAFFFEQGYLCLRAFVPAEELRRLQAAYQELVERHRSVGASDYDVVIESDHSPRSPRLKRINRATDQHPAFWHYASDSVHTDMVADLLGPDVRYRESYINCKWAHGGDVIDWHQDLPFFPHTNRTLLTAITYLADVGADMAPTTVLPGSHKAEIFDHYDRDGAWAGRVSDADLARLPMEATVPLAGPAGTVIVFDCLTLHSSGRNQSARGRPVLLTGYTSADTFPYTVQTPSMCASQTRQIVRGRPARYAHHEPLHIKMPPDWRHEEYVNIFDAQKDDESGSPDG